MTDTQPSSADPMALAIARLQDLQRTERRARLQALIPIIDSLVRQGVRHDAIVQTLAESGIDVTLGAMRKSLYRWRKRQTTPSVPDAPPRAAALPVSVASSPQRPSQLEVGPITSKADLVRLRSSKDGIDLNALAEIGRQK